MHVDWDDPSAGEWIAPLLGTPGTLGGGVPEGYEAHVRLPNSADPQDNEASLVQRSCVSEPDERDQLDRLLAVLAPVTGGQVCHFAMWSGWAWLIDADADPSRHTASVPGMAFPVWTSPWARWRALRRYQEQHADAPVRRPRGGYLTPFGAGLGQDSCCTPARWRKQEARRRSRLTQAGRLRAAKPGRRRAGSARRLLLQVDPHAQRLQRHPLARARVHGRGDRGVAQLLR